jgi:hypothetical protein
VELANLEELTSMSKEDTELRRQRRADLETRASTQAYRLLAKVLGSSNGVLRRECLLTAFSLAPSTDLFKDLEDCARAAGVAVEGSEGDNREGTQTLKPMREILFLPKEDEFNQVCQDFISSLKDVDEDAKNSKKVFLDGLLSIEGEVLTSREDYDPDRCPLAVFRPDQEELGLSELELRDILVVLSAPRWHLLSWVLDWKELRERCRTVLRTPSVRLPKEELRNLVIDYDCSDDDDDCAMVGGEETGYDEWESSQA